ncbi:poly-beta-1,6 N-acetyl-D-glucosamine export porin PgaA [Halothiobacillus sp. DCM-1]|uniref:poly-beta-1,6 N-acetyl-D-glucosamine export porin PgaA n=1 Tax=Halothiobacillus sp. DCM-1 TaxID=3112558 RepID=UPI00324FE849
MNRIKPSIRRLPRAQLGFLIGCLGLLSLDTAFALPVIPPDLPALQQQRWQAVDLAKSGQISAGIQRLQALAAAHPTDPWITADLIVLLRRAGQNQAISQLTAHKNPLDIPNYAWMDWAQALRDEKQFDRAAAVLAPSATSLPTEGKILYAMILAEGGQFPAAIAALPDAQMPGLTPTNLANMAYVYRLAGRPETAIRLTDQALQADPNNRWAIREQVFSLSALHAAFKAEQLALKHRDWFSHPERQQLQASVVTETVRAAYDERKRLDRAHRFAERDIPLQNALKQLQANRIAFADNPRLQLSTRYDEIFVLRELRLWKQAIAEFEALPQAPRTASEQTLRDIPAYVRTAAAEAYDAEKQPQEAIRLLESVVQQNPGSDVAVYLSLYYAYLDAEDYAKGEALLQTLHRVTPEWERGTVRSPNWERMDIDQAWVMDPAYRNDPALAEQRGRALMNAAPFNTGSINTLATLENWRGWPEQSLKTTQLAQAYSPQSQGTRLNLAQNYRDLGWNARWGTEINELYALFPKDQSIKKQWLAWQDRRDPSISSEYTTGKSRGNSTVANPVTGNRDQEWLTRLNSPWIGNWRGFIQHHWIWSSYDEGPISFNRLGIGAEWQHDRRHFWTMLSNDQLTGQHVGLSLGWSQWLDDQWQYRLTADTYSIQTPLRAKRAGYSGKSVTANVIWRQSESREAYVGLSALDISDGNKRIDFSAGATQRVWASPHHITSLGVDLFAEHNTQPGGDYFNPANSQSINLRLEHQWITWRHYDRSLTQYFKISPGYGWQDGFGGAPTVDLFYEHKWQLSRTWDLHYGVGWGSNVYDGGREGRLYGLIGFGGVF